MIPKANDVLLSFMVTSVSPILAHENRSGVNYATVRLRIFCYRKLKIRVLPERGQQTCFILPFRASLYFSFRQQCGIRFPKSLSGLLFGHVCGVCGGPPVSSKCLLPPPGEDTFLLCSTATWSKTLEGSLSLLRFLKPHTCTRCSLATEGTQPSNKLNRNETLGMGISN